MLAGAFKFTAEGPPPGCGPSPTSATVNFTLGGTAQANVDYTGPLTAGTVTIPMVNGYGEKMVTFEAVDDLLVEAVSETVILESVTATADNGFTASVVQNDQNLVFDNEPTATIGVEQNGSESPPPGGETPVPVKFSVGLDRPASQAFTVNLNVISGTATEGLDFIVPSPESVAFAAGQVSASFEVAVLTDQLAEGTETLDCELVAGAGYAIGTPARTTASIADDPPPAQVSVDATDAGASEVGPDRGTLRFTRSGGDLTLGLTVRYKVADPDPPQVGVANDGEDFSLPGSAAAPGPDDPAGFSFRTVTFSANQTQVSIDLTPVSDASPEGDEAAEASVAPPQGETAYEAAGRAATITIADKPVVSIEAQEPDAYEAGPQSGILRVSRAITMPDALTVTFGASGSGANADDISSPALTEDPLTGALTGSVTIPGGQAFADVPVTPRQDQAVEGNELVTATLIEEPAYAVGIPNSAAVTIYDRITIDLVVGGMAEDVLPDGSSAPTPHELDPGALVPLNFDSDEADTSSLGDEPSLPDYATPLAVPWDDELVPASLTIRSSYSAGGSWKLEYPDQLQVHREVEQTDPLTGEKIIVLAPIASGESVTETLEENVARRIRLWVEGAEMGENLAMTATFSAAAGAAAPADEVKDKANVDVDDVLVVLISGHTQNGGNDNDKPGGDTTDDFEPSIDAGIRTLADRLHAAGFKRQRLFSEDPGNAKDTPYPNPLDTVSCGLNRDLIVNEVKTQIANAKRDGRKLRLALIGYSHGGGLLDWVAEDLADPAKNPDKDWYTLGFTAYIDAVDLPGKAAERDLPVRTAYHVNYYQSEQPLVVELFEPNGTATDGPTPPIQVNQNLDVDASGGKKDVIDHSGIDDNEPIVHRGIWQHIRKAFG